MTQTRMTAIRALRIGDRFFARSTPDAESARDIVTVCGLEDLEQSGQIRVTVDFVDGSKGEMEFSPVKKVRRVVDPGEEPGGVVMVSGNDLWKFVGANYHDPEGGNELFVIAGFKRPDPPDGTVWIGLKSKTSDRMFNQQLRTDASIFFEDEER